MASSETSSRAGELRRLVEHHNYRYHVLDDPEIPDSAFDALFDELKALEDEHPELVAPDSPTQRVGGAPAAGFTKVAHLQPMGSLEKVTTSEALEKWAADVRKRLGTDEPVAYVDRAEDRRLGDLARLRGRRLRPRRDARRRHAGRGRDPEPPDGRSGAPPRPNSRLGESALAARGARRDLLPAVRVRALHGGAGRGRQEAGAESTERGRRLAAPARLEGHGRAPAVALGVRRGRPRGRFPPDAVGASRLAPRARLPHEPERRAARVDRRGRRGVSRVGGAPGGARLRDRRDRDQGRRPRPAAPPWRAARAATLGEGVQVGALDGHHDAAQDPHPRGAYGRAQPVGRARARACRRRDGLERDAPQRGGHQPQGHPRGRPGDRPARRRRDPTGRRPRRGARAGHEGSFACPSGARSAASTWSSPRAR